MSKRVSMLILSGSMGAGKTTVMGEISDLLADSDAAHATLDFDCLGQVHPHVPDGFAFRNLKSIWPNYRDAGVTRLVIAAAVERRSELASYRDAIPGAALAVCRLTAPVATMQERLRVREPGIWQPRFLARAEELNGILTAAAVEDFTVANGPDRDITEVAREVLERAAWRRTSRPTSKSGR